MVKHIRKQKQKGKRRMEEEEWKGSVCTQEGSRNDSQPQKCTAKARQRSQRLKEHKRFLEPKSVSQEIKQRHRWADVWINYVQWQKDMFCNCNWVMLCFLFFFLLPSQTVLDLDNKFALLLWNAKFQRTLKDRSTEAHETRKQPLFKLSVALITHNDAQNDMNRALTCFSTNKSLYKPFPNPLQRNQRAKSTKCFS